MSSVDNQTQPIYEIVIQGELDQSWQQWFNGLAVTLSCTSERSPATTLVAPAADQAALRGMLCKLWDLNLTLISVRRINAGGQEER